MCKKNYKKNGFTLVEILIVIMIVGLLSVLAINGYSTYRKSAILDLTADGFVSYFSWANEKSLYGTYGDEKIKKIENFFEGGQEKFVLSTRAELIKSSDLSSPKCYGVYFNIDNDDYVTGVFEQNFAGKRVFVGEKWIYQGCADIGPLDFEDNLSSKVNVLRDELNLESGLIIKDLLYFSSTGSSPLKINESILRFSPPDSFFDVKIGSGNFINTFFEGQRIELIFGYENNEADQSDRKVVFDLYNKKAYVEKIL